MSQGLRVLRERAEALPGALRAQLERPDPAAPFDPRLVRSIVTTGLGSSAANARFLAHVLWQSLGLPARFVSTGSLASSTPPGALRDALVVFSQGLSPNARFAFERAEQWGAVVLVTAPGTSSSGPPPTPARAPGGAPRERAEWLASLRARGASILEIPAGGEFGTLVRVVGPVLGFAASLSLARSLARAAGLDAPELSPDPGRLVERVAAAPDTLDAALPDGRLEDLLAQDLAPLAAGGYGELIENVRTKLLEGLLRPPPPLWDGLELAHGGLQQLWPGRALLLHFARAGRQEDTDLGAALASTLDASRHALVTLEAREPGPAAVFEHEAMIDALLLRWLDETGRDPADWPARDRDGPLYDRSPALDPAAPPLARGLELSPSFERLRWTELEARIEARDQTAVLGLGSIEQHGPHLPLATDRWIAKWLAERVAARLDDALRLPVLPLGCASEHASFAGTLSLEPDTFERMLRDTLRSLARHGFARTFVFSAHGGNLPTLRDAADRLADAARPMSLIVFDDHARLGRRLAEPGRAAGLRPSEQGQHAGELETSILCALEPGAVALEHAAAGRIVEGDAQSIFYPDLRASSASGVVGDPTRAHPSRADAYLEAWADELVDFYRTRMARNRA